MPDSKVLKWDVTGDHLYETGIDRVVLYPYNNGYPKGYAWNGVTAVSESPSGADSNPLYADNIKYLNLVSAEEFGATIEAYTYPDEFKACNGEGTPTDVIGARAGQQTRKTFGLSYRTVLGNDTEGNDHGYQLHLVYNATAAPSERSYSTINESPEAITMSWTISTTPVAVEGYANIKPTALITVDSTAFDTPEKKELLTKLKDALWGTDGDSTVDPVVPAADAHLPSPGEVFDMLQL